jgi:murein tripeptide amidase MpaA
MIRNPLIAVLILLSPLASVAAALTTHAEQTHFKRTGRYDEVISLCAALEKAHPKAVRCITFGTTPEGRPMKALVATRANAFTPKDARKRNLPVLLVQGGIHAGEIDGKDAGFLALREVLEGRAAPGALEKQVLVFVPVFNVDGHERFGKWNRPNQRGPEEMGWRTTAQNLNLNRDYVKADAPEMQAMLKLINDWDPLATIDLHVTNGAKFEHDIAIMVEPGYAGDEALRTAGRQFRDGVIADLAKSGSLPLPFYPSFIENDNPASGVRDGPSPARFSTGYFPTRNRFGMLVETHSWKDYPTRVRITRNTVVSCIEHVAKSGREWLKLAHDADLRAARFGGQTVVLNYKSTEKFRTIDFRGYAYTRTLSEISGALMTRYDETKPEIWKLKLFDNVVPNRSVVAPIGGYLIPPAWAAMVGEKLALHGIAFQKLKQAADVSNAEEFRAASFKPEAASFEGRQMLTVDGVWNAGIKSRSVPAGSLYVPIAQPKSRLVMTLLEPTSPDALLAWGHFNAAFEMKEYMEAYVAEEVARDLLARDAAVAAEFNKRLANDAAFAKDPAARLEFFHRRHSSWDDRYGVYPVIRVGQVPVGRSDRP